VRSSDQLEREYTLVIPTHSRPKDLNRLLRYLDWKGAKFRILVLDSSAPDTQEVNRALANSFDLNLTFHAFDSALHPYRKFHLGLEMVKTPYCSLCADDDLVMIDGLDICVEFLSANADFSIAHGVYFNFSDRGDVIDLISMAQEGASIVADAPLERLRKFIPNYDVLVYAVARREVIAAAFGKGLNLGSFLLAELLSGALIAIAGKIARLPVFYCSRSTAPSQFYADWHPHQFLAGSARLLFEKYLAYRDILMVELEKAGNTLNAAGTREILDLVHLQYLGPFLRGDILEFISERKMAGMAPRDIVAGIWDRWVDSKRTVHPVKSYHVASGEWDIKHLSRAPQPHDAAPEQIYDYLLESQTRDGAPRVYKIFDEFLFPAPSKRVANSDLRQIVRNFDSYY